MREGKPFKGKNNTVPQTKKFLHRNRNNSLSVTNQEEKRKDMRKYRGFVDGTKKQNQHRGPRQKERVLIGGEKAVSTARGGSLGWREGGKGPIGSNTRSLVRS